MSTRDNIYSKFDDFKSQSSDDIDVILKNFKILYNSDNTNTDQNKALVNYVYNQFFYCQAR